MPKFKSIPHEVTAVQWKGEVTPELQSLFGDRKVVWKRAVLIESRSPLAGTPLLVVPAEDHSEVIAEPGDWVVRTDYDHGTGEDGDRGIPVFDLDVMEHDDFTATYEPDGGGFELNIAVPAILTSASGEATTDIRMRFASAYRVEEIMIAAVTTQLLRHIKQPATIVNCVQLLCAEADPDTLITIRDAVERTMVARSTHH